MIDRSQLSNRNQVILDFLLYELFLKLLNINEKYLIKINHAQQQA
ncbi:hypothetical protein EMUCRT_0709 [Ehrlichia cf. muris str. EmCRT]|uniref:Uncharacterized protein n=1 Tax=Ehrlichia cf. muris str. EmCRT TaxID=1359167 RepID=A0A0F3NDG2_9RICK|nr:hypothetical protein EMUCRT_0709 [Ehrlichia cf. muris str. EmCRT]